MRKIIIVGLALMMLGMTFSGIVSAQTEIPAAKKEKVSVNLTDEQIQELSVLYKEMMQQKKMIVTKYVEYGAMPQEQADKLLAHMEKRFAKLEANGFVWSCEKKDKKQSQKNH
jgi:hypothetical protein